MHLVDQVGRMQQIGLARAGGGTAHVDAGHGTLAGDQHGAAGRTARVGEVADLVSSSACADGSSC
jgi:hypothetical protein